MKGYWSSFHSEHLLAIVMLVLFVATMWHIHTFEKRQVVRFLTLEVRLDEMRSRVINRWTREDQTLWAAELKKRNPALDVPSVPAAKDLQLPPSVVAPKP